MEKKKGRREEQKNRRMEKGKKGSREEEKKARKQKKGKSVKRTNSGRKDWK